ncbi:MAG: HEAT repeat domain-containing protein, partial [Desulfobacterales bacterium]|nr:HEAT repeat domain-containing protein [Desulfobacterales bacterium]
EALRSTDPGLRRAAAKALSLRPDPDVTDRLLTLLDSDDPALARSAAEGLGRLRARAAVPVLLSATAKADDPFLEHSLTHSLIAIGSSGGTRTGLASAISRTQRAALIALDQMEGGNLLASEVVPFLTATDERLRSAAQWILRNHPVWGAELAGWFRARLTGPNALPEVVQTLNGQLAILTQDALGQDLLANAVTGTGFESGTRIAALKAMSDAAPKDVPASWRTSVLSVLKAGNPAVAHAVQTARSMNSDAAVNEALLVLALDSSQSAELRLDALASLAPGGRLGSGEIAFLQTQLGASNSPAVRTKAAGVIARARLDPATLATLCTDLQTAGPLELNLLLQSFDGGGDEALGRALLSALQESKSARSLHPTQLKTHFAKFPEAVRTDADTYVASLNADAAQQSARLDAMLTDLKAASGDLRRGQGVFNGSKAACA